MTNSFELQQKETFNLTKNHLVIVGASKVFRASSFKGVFRQFASWNSTKMRYYKSIKNLIRSDMFQGLSVIFFVEVVQGQFCIFRNQQCFDLWREPINLVRRFLLCLHIEKHVQILNENSVFRMFFTIIILLRAILWYCEELWFLGKRILELF